MKKVMTIFGAMLFALTTLTNFGGCSSDGNADSTARAAAAPSVCKCEDLKQQKEKYFLADAVEPYTGVCTTTDKYDSVIATKTYKRGFLMHIIE